MGFFDLSRSQDGSGSAAAAANSRGETLSDAELFLQWTIVFYPLPVVLAWLLVYPGHLLPCPSVRRLWETRSYAYNLLLASLAVAAGYVAVLKWVGLSFNSGPKRNAGIITGVCVFGLVALNVVAEHKASRRRRPDRHREFGTSRQSVELAPPRPESRPEPPEPNGLVKEAWSAVAAEEQHGESPLEPTSIAMKITLFDRQRPTAT